MNQHPVKVAILSKQKIVKGLIVPKGSLLLSLWHLEFIFNNLKSSVPRTVINSPQL